MTDALEIALKNNIDRIAGALLLGKDLNPPNRLKFPCCICNKSVQKIKMLFNVTNATNGSTGNVKECLLKNTSFTATMKLSFIACIAR